MYLIQDPFLFTDTVKATFGNSELPDNLLIPDFDNNDFRLHFNLHAFLVNRLEDHRLEPSTEKELRAILHILRKERQQQSYYLPFLPDFGHFGG